MRSSPSRKVKLQFVSISASVSLAAIVVFACSDDDTKPLVADPQNGDAGGRPPSKGSSSGDEEEELDAGGTKKDAASSDATAITDAKAGKDANGPGEAGTECFFNRECQSALRCHDNGVSFTCSAGVRGTGRVGIDRCDSGDQCASSVCLDGPTNGQLFCSDECLDPTECAGVLPRCIGIVPFPSKICVRPL